jgi:hypothetical protein
MKQSVTIEIAAPPEQRLMLYRQRARDLGVL